MANLVKALEADVKKVEDWFTKQEASAKKVFARVEPYMVKAESAVNLIANVAAKVSTGVPALAPYGALLSEVITVLHSVSAGDAAVVAFAQAHQSASVPSLLHDAAVAILTATHANAANALLSDLDLAVQIAYSVVKKA